MVLPVNGFLEGAGLLAALGARWIHLSMLIPEWSHAYHHGAGWMPFLRKKKKEVHDPTLCYDAGGRREDGMSSCTCLYYYCIPQDGDP